MTKRVLQMVALDLLSLCLINCSAPRWEHETQGMQRLEEDRRDCLNASTLEAMQIDPHTGVVFDKHEAVSQCLTRKGYVQRSQD